MSAFLQLPSPLEKVSSSLLGDVAVWMKRDDLIHPEIPGNKWRKLKYNILKAQQTNQKILTFGGAFSNHISATAAACKYLKIPCVGIIRGEKVSNPALQKAENDGMQLYFVDRKTYQLKTSPEFFSHFSAINPDEFWIIPEGGANEEGVMGCAEIVSEINMPFDYIINACGTGTTSAGLLRNLPEGTVNIGVSALKGGEFIRQDVQRYSPVQQFNLQTDFHFGGYAKTTPELLAFIRQFQAETGIMLDYVYTGKMMFALHSLIKSGYFKNGATIIALHTGGVQNASVC